MLVLPLSLGIVLNDTLVITEVDSLNVPTGLTGYGTIEKIVSGQFYNLPVIYNQYYLNPLNMFTWVDYSATSTVVGFSSTTIKVVKYCKIGSTVFWRCELDGTSNSTSLTFTLPYENVGNSGGCMSLGRVCNNGSGLAGAGMAIIGVSSKIVNLRSTLTSAAWTAANRKFFYGSGFYEAEP